MLTALMSMLVLNEGIETERDTSLEDCETMRPCTMYGRSGKASLTKNDKNSCTVAMPTKH